MLCIIARALNATYAINIVFWLGGKVMPVSVTGVLQCCFVTNDLSYLMADPSLRVRSCKSTSWFIASRSARFDRPFDFHPNFFLHSRKFPFEPHLNLSRLEFLKNSCVKGETKERESIYIYIHRQEWEEKICRIDRILILQANYPALSRKWR